MLYYYGYLDRHDHDDIIDEGGQCPPLSRFKSFLTFVNRRENRSLVILGLWITTGEVNSAIGHSHTNLSLAWFWLSSVFWLNAPAFYFINRLHNVLSQMSPSGISSYLSTNILTVGISSITPMMYLSMDTLICTRNADRTKSILDQYSGVLYPQLSICIFLLIMMFIKVLVAPLSTTTLTANDLIKLNLPRRLIFQGTLFGLSFLLNIYLFANMEEGESTKSIVGIVFMSIFLALMPLFLELSHMVFHHAHRTSLAPPPLKSPSPPLTPSPLALPKAV